MRVLITLTDVEPAVRINAALEQSGVETDVVSPLDDVRSAVRRFKPDVFVLSGALLDAQNVALVREALWDGVPVVGLSDIGDDAMTARLRVIGYSEIYQKPVVPGDVVAGIRRLADRQALARLTGLYGESEAIREVLVRVEQMAPVSSTVLVEGESGTGKELVARAMHVLGPRRSGPFIAVNVGALPDTLVESELFGHERGAFTGAHTQRTGRFELANGGTLFLDEVGEIASGTQVKLLRVLEERELTRVGGTQPIRVDVRVVAATNRSLREAVEEGAFRSDLYYRLNVLSIYLPPLRERKADIPLLVRRFIQEFSAQHDRPFHGISGEALQVLVDYPWPGNVRELRNLVESMVVLAPGHEIGPEDIPRQIREGAGRLLPVPMPLGRARYAVDGGREMEVVIRSLVDLKLQVEELRRRLDEERVGAVGGGGGGWVGELAGGPARGPGPGAQGVNAAGSVAGLGAGGIGIEPPGALAPPNVVTITPGMTMAEIERAAIEAALKEMRGNRRKAAEMLGIGERTLYRKLREYQIPDPAAVLD